MLEKLKVLKKQKMLKWLKRLKGLKGFKGLSTLFIACVEDSFLVSLTSVLWPLKTIALKVWWEKNKTNSRIGQEEKKSTFLVLSSWNLVKTMNTWGDFFHQLSWGLDKNYGNFINGQFFERVGIFFTETLLGGLIFISTTVLHVLFTYCAGKKYGIITINQSVSACMVLLCILFDICLWYWMSIC